MSKKTVTPFGMAPSPEERDTVIAMTGALPRHIESSRKHATFATPRGDETPQHAGASVPMHTPVSDKDEYFFQVRCKGMEENVILSTDDSESFIQARQAACDTMKQFFWRSASTKESSLMTIFNFFHNARTEESYQLDVSQQSIYQSQVVLFLLIVSRVAMVVWWFNTKHDTPLVGMDFIADKYADPFHWAFLPLAVMALLPFRVFNSWGKTKLFAYWIRRYWKHFVTLILMLFCVGYFVYYKTVHRSSLSDFRTRHNNAGSCGRDIAGMHAGAASLFDDIAASISGLQDYLYNMFIINVTATSLVLCLTLKLDFPQAALVLGSSFVFYLLDWTLDPPTNAVYYTSNYFVFSFAIVLPIVTGLTAFYFIDRDARMAFFSKVNAERVNTALKHGVTVNRLQYQTQGRVGVFEEQLLLELLAKTPENALIHNVSIPFGDLTLHELMTEHAKGDVVRGEYTGLRVAIKRLSVLTRETIMDFKAHVELLACLRHPNVVQFIGASFDVLTNVCVVTEYVEKGNVYNLLRTPMALEWNDPLLQIAIDAAQGIAYLHHSNVIHRDLKCENLLCTATYACKVSDFGESKQVQTQECLETMVGTPYWLAPEILREIPYQNKVDCYSFGIVLIELESRRDPYFDCDDLRTIDIMMQVAMGTLRPTIPPTCPPRRRALIEQCLSDLPTERPSMVTILKTLQTDIRDEVLGSRLNFSDPQQNRRQLLQKHQMLNRRGLHEVLASDQE